MMMMRNDTHCVVHLFHSSIGGILFGNWDFIEAINFGNWGSTEEEVIIIIVVIGGGMEE